MCPLVVPAVPPLPIAASATGSAALLNAQQKHNNDNSASGNESVSAVQLLSELCPVAPGNILGGLCHREPEYKVYRFKPKTDFSHVKHDSSIQQTSEAESQSSFYRRQNGQLLMSAVDKELKRLLSPADETREALRNLEKIFNEFLERGDFENLQRSSQRLRQIAGGSLDSQSFAPLGKLVAKYELLGFQRRAALADSHSDVDTSHGQSPKTGKTPSDADGAAGIVIAPEPPPDFSKMQLPYIFVAGKPQIIVLDSPPPKQQTISDTGEQKPLDVSIKSGIVAGAPLVQPGKGENLLHDHIHHLESLQPGSDNNPSLESSASGGIRQSERASISSPNEAYADMSKRIRQFVDASGKSKQIMVVGHRNLDYDALASLIETVRIARGVSSDPEKVTGYVAKESTSSNILSWLAAGNTETLGIRVEPSKVIRATSKLDDSAVIVVDTSDLGNTDLANEHPGRVMALDHHTIAGNKIGDTGVYQIPALSLALSQELSHNHSASSYRDVAALAGILSDTCVDNFWFKNKELADKLLTQQELGDAIFRLGSQSGQTEPTSLSALVNLHKELESGKLSPHVIKPQYLNTLKNDPTLKYLADDGSRELLETLDLLLAKVAVGDSSQKALFESFLQSGRDTLKAIDEKATLIPPEQSGRNFAEYVIANHPSGLCGSLGLFSFSRFAKPEQTIVARADLDNKQHQASVLLSGEHSEARAKMLEQALAEQGITGGYAPAIYGPQAIIRFGVKFPADKLELFHQTLNKIVGR